MLRPGGTLSSLGVYSGDLKIPTRCLRAWSGGTIQSGPRSVRVKVAHAPPYGGDCNRAGRYAPACDPPLHPGSGRGGIRSVRQTSVTACSRWPSRHEASVTAAVRGAFRFPAPRTAAAPAGCLVLVHRSHCRALRLPALCCLIPRQLPPHRRQAPASGRGRARRTQPISAIRSRNRPLEQAPLLQQPHRRARTPRSCGLRAGGRCCGPTPARLSEGQVHADGVERLRIWKVGPQRVRSDAYRRRIPACRAS